ncbi:hypothetical protein B0T14DRAFT_563714 [Immersiella caudata]|uniref:Uncharacterized protein n=1 Tax=Immersiella caudata TaxID=314043 RepID=A0AA40C8C3_9PEZI|nr:hypothetical protein B0T14DRAFT_563714 [Immersiella caudata]
MAAAAGQPCDFQTAPCPQGEFCERNDPGCDLGENCAGTCHPLPTYQFCGGLAHVQCKDYGQKCYDDPRDECSLDHGDADCGGICLDHHHHPTHLRLQSAQIKPPPPKRTVLITGCSDGSLGSALALAFHASTSGWRVFASARNPAKLTACTTAGIETLCLDTTSPASIASAVSHISALVGDSGLDALLNNAGAGYSMPLIDLDINKAKALYDVNVWSLIGVTRAFLPLLRKSSHPYGPLVANNTSQSSQIPGTVPFTAAYTSSKAAATSLTEAMRLELGVLGIKVVNLMTGTVDSGFRGNLERLEIPGDSPYVKVKEEVEKAMAMEGMDDGAMDAGVWAAEVVRELGREKPSHWVWKGTFSGLVRLANHLPVGLLDGKMKEVSGLDAVEKRVRELGGPRGLLADDRK